MKPLRLQKKHFVCLTALLFALVTAFAILANPAPDPESETLSKYTDLTLVDWHICGLWVINSPVAWVRVKNNNNVPVKDICFEYRTFAADGRQLDQGTYTLEGRIDPYTSKNFIELYLGLVDLYTERMSIKLLSVRRAEN